MALKIINSCQIEELADKLVSDLKSERATRGRFEFLKVSVANPNLGNWLKMKVLAHEPELCAGVEMPFLTEELERILRENCKPGVEVVSGRDYPLVILNILMKEEREDFAPFCKYIKEEHHQPGPLTIVSQREARRAVQLANRLGQIIDDYEATGYLPLLEEFKDKSEVYKGEQALVDAMKGVTSLRKVFERVKDVPPAGTPEKILLFGHTTLTAIQREMLEWIARTHEVIWYQPKVEMRVREGVKVRVVGAPGIRREVEMVHENILEAVWDRNENGKPIKKDGISFSDVAVLVADMPKYRTMVESVFDGRGQIPYGLIDATTQNYSSYLDGFLALMDVARYGLNRERLFAALDNPCVQRGMCFSRDDVDGWRELAEKVGAYEGYEVADSDEGNASGRFNWSWALQRLRLGLVAQTAGGVELEAYDTDSVERLSEVVETLHRRLSALNGKRALCASVDEKVWPGTWAGRLHGIMDEFLSIDSEDGVEAMVRAQIVRTLNGLSVIEGEQTYRLPVAIVENVVSGVECAKGGYLRHGVTIGGLRSLAHVPFKRIFVVGLAEGTLPGRNGQSTLDVRNELSDDDRRTRGEILPPDEGRGRFAAAVSSAIEEVVLSYPCVNLQTDAMLYPTPLIWEIAGREVKPERCPLVDDWVALGAGQPKDVVPGNADTIKLPDPTVKDYVQLVRDPFAAVLTRRFKIAKLTWRDNAITAESPIGADGDNVKYELEDAAVAQTFDATFEELELKGRLPSSFLGDFAKKRLDGAQAWAMANVSDEDRELLKIGGAREGYAVICRHFGDGGEGAPITIPPACVLDPLYEALVRYSETETDGDFKLRIRVIALEQFVKTWKWRISRETVKSHLADLQTWYMKIPPAVGFEKGRWLHQKVVPGYDALREQIRILTNVPTDGTGWEGLAARLVFPEGGLVIDRALERWRRLPNGSELQNMYEEIFKLAMSGEEVVEENEVEHE